MKTIPDSLAFLKKRLDIQTSADLKNFTKENQKGDNPSSLLLDFPASFPIFLHNPKLRVETNK